jgi:hypothetical protein
MSRIITLHATNDLFPHDSRDGSSMRTPDWRLRATKDMKQEFSKHAPKFAFLLIVGVTEGIVAMLQAWKGNFPNSDACNAVWMHFVSVMTVRS